MKIRNIDNMVETRKDICRYGNENKIIKEYAQFGWTFESKRLLNRFGNPLPSATTLPLYVDQEYLAILQHKQTMEIS